MFPLNAKKVRICEIMSGGFAVKIQQCVKKSPAVFGNFFILLKFLQFCQENLNQLLNAWETVKRNPSEDRCFFRAVQRLTQTSHGCDATASDGDLNIAHAFASLFCITNYLSRN